MEQTAMEIKSTETFIEHDIVVDGTNVGNVELCPDCISRQAAIDALRNRWLKTMNFDGIGEDIAEECEICLRTVPSAQPERKWIPCSNPPKHHKDVIVRGIEAIGNVTVHKVMQWDVDTWRPTDYAPSIIWKEWSEI